jgi:hypothetical protein
MDQSDITNRLKRLKNNYRLVLMNEDTYEEVIKFKLTRLSVYIFMSTLFVLLVALTASLIIFTPLKYYLPGVGYGNVKQVKEFKKLKARTDSMEKALNQQQVYYDNIDKVLKGKFVIKDTNNLKMPKLDNIDD